MVQFSPTRTVPSWLNITSIEYDDGRARTPPQDPAERARFIQHCMFYVNFTVDYFNAKPYAARIEYCLDDEPHSADWADVFMTMHASIKTKLPAAIVSLVLHKPELYPVFKNSFDMITIDPYNDGYEMVQKIQKAHADVNNAKPVRVIVSGMHDDEFDYQRIYRQLVISWFTWTIPYRTRRMLRQRPRP
ncbi:MAG: hypothetical protein Q6365_014285 [Candidatus Sigynarchaeota archaeon]